MKNALLLLLISLALSWGCTDQNRIVAPEEMEDYAEVYLKTYRDLVEEEILPAFRKHFDFYQESPFAVLTTISATHGAAVEFVPSDAESFVNRSVIERVEHAVFKDRDLNIEKGPVSTDGGTALIYTGEPGPVVNVTAEHISIQALSVITNKGYFVRVAETGSLHTKDISVDGIGYAHAILVKGSNQYKHWTPKNARRDGWAFLWHQVKAAFIKSEEFRRFIACPELTAIAKRILKREEARKYNGEHGILLYEEDFNELYAAATKYKVTHEFAENIYRFHSRLRSIKPGFWARHFDQVVTGLVIVVLVSSFSACFVWLRRKRKGKRPGRKGSIIDEEDG